MVSALVIVTLLPFVFSGASHNQGNGQGGILLAPSAGFTLTPERANVTADAGVTAQATVLVHATGGPLSVQLSLTQLNEDLRCTSPAPSPVQVPPDINVTFACSSDASNIYPVTVVGKSSQLPSSSVLVHFIFMGPSSSSSLPNDPVQVSVTYVEIAAAVAVPLVIGIATFANRKRKPSEISS